MVEPSEPPPTVDREPLAEEAESEKKEPTMRVLCLLGRHKWRVDNSDPERPFEVCDRCGHYRSGDVSWSVPTAQANMRPMDHHPGAGGGGGGFSAFGGGDGGGGG